MSPPHRSPEAIDEKIVLAEHLHQRVFDELPGGAGREQGFSLLPPGVAYRVAPAHRLDVAGLGVG